MRASKILSLSILIVFSVTIIPAQELKWFSFDTDFINAQFPTDSAIGKIKATHFARTKNAHPVSCGGNDGEMHIGIFLTDIDLPGSQSPASAASGKEAEWGIVAELPNAALAKGPALLTKLENQPITFEGYFRVWDEGHSIGTVFPSNPHHVFEVHPAWGFNGDGVNFSKPNLVNSVAGYAGYGGKKLERVLEGISGGNWPRVYRAGGQLHLGIAKAENFYQLSVKIKKVVNVTGGHELTMDVFSGNTFKKLLFTDLAGITVTGSPTDKTLKVGDKTFLLGFFSINLKKALKASAGADSMNEAKASKDSLEFFIFGPALLTAVSSCNKKDNEQ
jgi:hypothetical protein